MAHLIFEILCVHNHHFWAPSFFKQRTLSLSTCINSQILTITATQIEVLLCGDTTLICNVLTVNHLEFLDNKNIFFFFLFRPKLYFWGKTSHLVSFLWTQSISLATIILRILKRREKIKVESIIFFSEIEGFLSFQSSISRNCYWEPLKHSIKK